MLKPYYSDSLATIYYGDCREILPQLKDESADMVFTDPPYGHGNHQGDLNSRLNAHRNIEDAPIENDTPELMRELVDFAMEQSARILRKESCCCCCCGGGGSGESGPTFAWIAKRMDEKGLHFFHSVIWDKLNPGLGWRYRRQHEMVMVAHREGGKLKWINNDLAVSNIQRASPPRERLHPNEKPIELVTRFVSWHSQPGDTVLDPFMGSGTTLRAAKDLGISSIGIEMEEKYCEAAAKRLSQECLLFDVPKLEKYVEVVLL